MQLIHLQNGTAISKGHGSPKGKILLGTSRDYLHTPIVWGLASCFYATFFRLPIRKIVFTSATVEVFKTRRQNRYIGRSNDPDYQGCERPKANIEER